MGFRARYRVWGMASASSLSGLGFRVHFGFYEYGDRGLGFPGGVGCRASCGTRGRGVCFTV